MIDRSLAELLRTILWILNTALMKYSKDKRLIRNRARAGGIGTATGPPINMQGAKEHFAPSPRLASGSSSSLKKRKGGQENTQSSRRNAMGTAMQSCFAVDSNVWLIAGDMAHGL